MADPAQPADLGDEAIPEAGYVSDSLREEFPGLGLRYLIVERGSGPSPAAVKKRLRALSDRFGGAQAIQLRQRPIPAAYRVFMRQIGLDPDHQPSPAEEVALERMKRGGYRSQSLLDDALTIAIAESSVAMWALDAGAIEGRLGIRQTEPAEELEGRPGALPPGTLAICDEQRPLALLFGAIGSGRGVDPDTKRTAICAVQVAGVPDIALEEAIWVAAGVLRG